jgi:hypothetical protein
MSRSWKSLDRPSGHAADSSVVENPIEGAADGEITFRPDAALYLGAPVAYTTSKWHALVGTPAARPRWQPRFPVRICTTEDGRRTRLLGVHGSV